MVRFTTRTSRFASLMIGQNTETILCLDGDRSNPIPATDGFKALEFLSRYWQCAIEDISYNLPTEITSLQDELDVVTFYRGCGFVDSVRRYDDPYGVYWADYEWSGTRRGYVPVWRKAVLEVQWHILSGVPAHENFERALSRQFNLYVDHFCGEPYHSQVDLLEIQAGFYVMEGAEDSASRYHMTRRSDRTYEVRVPISKTQAETVARFVQTGMDKIMAEYCAKQFGSRDTDVVEVICVDFERNINASAIQSWDWTGHSTKYDVPWQGHNSFLLLRIRRDANGKVCCPDEFKGRVIGRRGVKISGIALKHGYQWLQAI